MADRTLRVEIVGDASSLEKTFRQSADGSSKFGSALAKVGKAAAFAGGAAALGGLALTLKAGISEFSEATKVSAQTAAVLKSTGGAAHVTAKEVDALAASLLRKTGIDDETIKSGENLLLTFTNIRNEAGRGNDIFTQSTKALADMSVALGKDVSSSAIQLGKALNDPIKGMTALRRAGVSFTEGQTNLVKSLVESGHSMDAQKLILRELNKEFGGSAEAAGKTLPGQINILKESFNNMAGDLVAKAVPALSTFVTFLNEKGVPAIGEAFGKISEVLGPAISNLGEALKQAGPAILGILEPLGAVVRDNLVPVFQQLQDIGVRAIAAVSEIIKANGPQLKQIFENLGTVISNLAKVVVPILEFAFTKILPTAIKVLIPILVILTDAIAKITTVVRVVVNAIEAVLLPALSAIIAVGTKVVTFLAKAFGPALEAIAAPVRAAAGVLKTVLGAAFDVVSAAIEGVKEGFDWLRDKALPLLVKLGRPLAAALAVITAPFQRLWDVIHGLVGAMEEFVDRVGDVISAAGKVTGAVGGILGHLPGRAAGGPVSQGRAYVVGEKGPELFVPGSNGSIIPDLRTPSSASGGGSAVASMVVQLVFNGPTVGTSREFEDTVRRALYDVQRRNPGTGLSTA